ncbi:secreted Ly-6/uPAR-related protein 1 isoform X2 [Nycticebus coucang]|uniref:secreted Ly-6/uPAR-related protein 1 isoform X2 n=1 Tax=Nycticebus coucang TaxID=9470 RepID=UPI00234C288A|nr:secreted Ly-6/uPAR-related protein 1 isoform X2 [Nycticebus coucang]
MGPCWAVRLLLMAACSMGCGEAFRCYNCEQPTAIASCKNITHCKPEDTACKTTLVTVESAPALPLTPTVSGMPTQSTAASVTSAIRRAAGWESFPQHLLS